MRELIACAPAVAVDAAVRTAAVYVHAVEPAFVMKDPFRFNEMHISTFPRILSAHGIRACRVRN